MQKLVLADCTAVAAWAARRTSAPCACGSPPSIVSLARTVRRMMRDAKAGSIQEVTAPVTPTKTSSKRKMICPPSGSPAERPMPLSPQVAGAGQQTSTGEARSQAHKELLPCGHLDLREIPDDDRNAEDVNHSAARPSRDSGPEGHAWIVYLLLSCDRQKTYVGVTSDLPRRLKQHNGELRGGAKSCRAGRPWEVVCTVRGFANKSEAFQFEWAWKAASKATRRRVPVPQELTETSTYLRLAPVVHRQSALEKTTSTVAFPQEQEIVWQTDRRVALPTIAKAF